MQKNLLRICSRALLIAALLWPSVTLAVSSWNPTLLVNTESFQEIDTGDGTTDLELRFGGTNNKLYYNISQSRFQFSKSLWVSGSITATGALTVRGHMSGASLNVSRNASINGNLTTSGSLQVQSTTTLNGNTKVRGNLSGSTLRIDGNADFWSTLSASGAIATKSNLTINSDADSNNGVLTFGNSSGNQSITFTHATQIFDFSKGIKAAGSIRAVGALSGSSLVVDGGSVKVNNVQYNFSGTQGAASTYLKNDGSGNLTWESVSSRNGSGGIVSVHPEYPNAVYFASGATTVGSLAYAYDATNKENYYRWQSSKGTAQDYWIALRVQVPKNFNNWTSTSPIQLRYRTSSTSSATNYITVRFYDTTGAGVAITGNANLASAVADTWTTATLSSVAGGTYTPDGYVTMLIKMATTSSGYADAGYINFNWSTTTP